jgi:hypothetical protein
VAGLAGAISGYKLALHAVNDLVRRSIQQSHVIAAARYFLLTLHLQVSV